MLSKPLLVLIVIAAIPATFLSYEAIDKWLERFVYHTSISALTFVIATVVVTIVALLTVALQSRKTAQSNRWRRCVTRSDRLAEFYSRPDHPPIVAAGSVAARRRAWRASCSARVGARAGQRCACALPGGAHG